MTASRYSEETVREEVVNTHLAELLQQRGVTARAERRSHGDAPDVRVELADGRNVFIECKYADASTRLDRQLAERLEDYPEVLAVFGLKYPSRIRRARNVPDQIAAATDLDWFLAGRLGKSEPARQIHTGGVDDLADHLRLLLQENESGDAVAAAVKLVGRQVNQCARAVLRHQRISWRIAKVIARTDQENDRVPAVQIGCLMLFNAVAFQDRLSAVRTDVPGIDESRRSGVSGMADDWDRICSEIDYVPVFELALEILLILADAPDDIGEQVVDALTKAAKGTRALEGHDLTGRLFHTLLTDAKFKGAYYTSVAAATLLARLVFEGWPADVDWSDHEFPASLDVADLACGTGTLLMAVAAEAERRHKLAGGDRAPDLHRAMVEQALHGFDVQLSAVHFAATSLAMLNPAILFDRMSMYVMPLGERDGDIALGSIDFLSRDEVAVQFAMPGAQDLVRSPRTARRVSGSRARRVSDRQTARLPELDLAIMNPPFTRSVGGNLLFGSSPKAERRKLQQELALRLRNKFASSTAGLGASFVAAAAPKLRPGEGRLALVLPATVCTGPSWRQTRALIESEFTLDTVISSHDPERWNFSDSTDLSESLLIATRRSGANKSNNHRTTFVNLWRNPENVLGAHRTAGAIATTSPAKLEESGAGLIELDGEHIGESFSIPASAASGNQWIGVQFARSDLARCVDSLLNSSKVWVPGTNSTANIPLCSIKELGSVGPDRRDVWDGFRRTDSATAYPALLNHDTKKRRMIQVEPNKFLAPLVNPPSGRKLKSIDQLWPKSGRLLIAERLRLDTARVASMRSEVNVLSNVWWPVRVDDAATEKALAIWFNSTLGLLTWITHRTTTEGGWVAMKKGDLEDLPVLDTTLIPSSQLQLLANLFDQLAGNEFECFSHMHNCEARARLDAGLSESLGLPDLSVIRQLLATEPVISKQRL